MCERELPIGVFDSGIGGLTVLEQLINYFPHENFIYVADQGNCPYGTKTPCEIAARVEKITSFLLASKVKAVVIACNTASVHIQRAQLLTNKPVIGMIEPTCERAVQVTENKKIAVLATAATIESGVYQNLLKKSGVTPVPLACGEFVEFLESGFCGLSVEDVVRSKLRPIKNAGMDVLIYGCTHFSLLDQQVNKVLGGVKCIACAQPSAEFLKKVLNENRLETPAKWKGKVELFTTGDVGKAAKTMNWFGCAHAPVRHIEIN